MLKNKKIAIVVTAVALAVGISGVAYSYTAPYKYVSFDINPSLELTTNIFDKVIEVEALNEDGANLIDSLDLENVDLKDAIDEVTEAAIDSGYLSEELQNEILVTVSSDNEEEAAKTEAELEEVIKEDLAEEDLEKTPITTQNVNLERHKEAKRLGISPGKMNLIQKLQAVNPEISLDEYASRPVKDIMKEIKEIRKENKLATKTGEEADNPVVEEVVEGEVVKDAEVIAPEETVEATAKIANQEQITQKVVKDKAKVEKVKEAKVEEKIKEDKIKEEKTKEENVKKSEEKVKDEKLKEEKVKDVKANQAKEPKANNENGGSDSKGNGQVKEKKNN